MCGVGSTSCRPWCAMADESVGRRRASRRHRARARVDRAELRALAEVLSSGRFGSEDRAYDLEAALGSAYGCGVAVTSSGSAALELTLTAAGIGAGHEVVVPALTCASVPDAVRAAGASPVFADVQPGTGVMDPVRLRACLGRRSTAVVVVDLYGCTGGSKAAVAVARERGVLAIHDTAAAFGADRSPPPAGLVQITSFHPSKVLAAGEGGAVLSADHELLADVRYLRSPGALAVRGVPTPPAFDGRPGRSLRMSDLDAALALVRLAKLDQVLARRRAAAARWHAALEHLGGPLGLPDPEGHAFACYPVVLPEGVNRAALLAELRAAGVGAWPGYQAVHSAPPGGTDGSDPCPVASQLASSVICLPTHPGALGAAVPDPVTVEAASAFLGRALAGH